MPNIFKRNFRKKSKKSKKGKSQRISHSSVNATRAGPSIRRYSGMRSFEFFSPSISDGFKPLVNWLTWLAKFGSVAMKFYAYAYGTTMHDGNLKATVVVTSASQGLIFGAEDFLYNSPIAEVSTKSSTDSRIFVGYNQARVGHVTFSISPGAELSKRAGRYAIAVVPLTYDQAARYLSEKATNDSVISTAENVSYEKLVSYPGAVTCAADKPTKVSFKTTGHSAAWHEIGGYARPTNDWFRGGIPLVKLLFAYQDMASASGAVSNLYSADEALFQLDVAGTVMLREPGEKFLRIQPLSTQNSNSVGVRLPWTPAITEIPLNQVTDIGGKLLIPTFPGTEDLEQISFVNNKKSKTSLDTDFEILSLSNNC